MEEGRERERTDCALERKREGRRVTLYSWRQWRTTVHCPGRNRQVCADAPQHPWAHVNPLVGARAFSDYGSDYETAAALCRAAGSRWLDPPSPFAPLHFPRTLSVSLFFLCASTPLSISFSLPLSLSLSFARVRVKFTNPYGALLAPLTSDSLSVFLAPCAST